VNGSCRNQELPDGDDDDPAFEALTGVPGFRRFQRAI
jgi:hypothetical protein